MSFMKLSVTETSKSYTLYLLTKESNLQEITQSSFKVCVKDTQGISKNHDPITVEYAVVGGKYSVQNFS